MVLVPRDTPGVQIVRMLTAMGQYDEPIGHGEVLFSDAPRYAALSKSEVRWADYLGVHGGEPFWRDAASLDLQWPIPRRQRRPPPAAG